MFKLFLGVIFFGLFVYLGALFAPGFQGVVLDAASSAVEFLQSALHALHAHFGRAPVL